MTDASGRLRDLARTHGRNAMSYAATHSGLQTWLADDGEAGIGYAAVRDRPGGRAAWVTAGPPIGPERRLPSAARAFEDAARRAGARVLWFGADDAFRSELPDHARLAIGAEPVWDPVRWAAILEARRSVRAQRNRARNKGESVAEWPAERAAASPALARVRAGWLRSRGLPPLGFVTNSDVLVVPTDRRVWVATRDGSPVAYLVTAPLPARGGWLVEWILQNDRAANGTATLLLDATFRQLEAEGTRTVSLGLVPLSTHAPATTPAPRVDVHLALGWMRAHARRFYDFEGLERFKAKFAPDAWEPIWLLSPEPIGLRALYAVAAAFAAPRSPERLVARALADAAAEEAHRAARRWRTATASDPSGRRGS